MSIKAHARSEMVRAGFPEDEIKAMEQILDIFFDNWDSGGAVWVMAPVLQKLIAGKPLSPLTGEADEWMDVSEDTLQNVRCSTVFNQNGRCYDIDTPGRPTITFPYTPEKATVSPPEMTVESKPIESHIYMPDYQAMGDCRVCGHGQHVPWHIGEVNAIDPSTKL